MPPALPVHYWDGRRVWPPISFGLLLAWSRVAGRPADRQRTENREESAAVKTVQVPVVVALLVCIGASSIGWAGHAGDTSGSAPLA